MGMLGGVTGKETFQTMSHTIRYGVMGAAADVRAASHDCQNSVWHKLMRH